jgi:hypothetical protein
MRKEDEAKMRRNTWKRRGEKREGIWKKELEQRRRTKKV